MSVKELCKGKTGHELRSCKAFFDMSVDGEQALKNAIKYERRAIKAKKNREALLKRQGGSKAKKVLGINKAK